MAFAYPCPPLGDGDVVLRPWDVERDLGAVAAAAQDPTIPATTTVPARPTPASARAWIDRQEDRRGDGHGVVLAIAPGGGDAVGMVGVTGVTAYARTGNLGYWVSPAHRGQGHARRAARLMADWAFDGLDLVRLEARIATDNAPSRHVVEKLGFACEGVALASLRLGDRWADVALYARIRTEPPVPRTTWTQYRQATRS